MYTIKQLRKTTFKKSMIGKITIRFKQKSLKKLQILIKLFQLNKKKNEKVLEECNLATSLG